MNNRKLKYVLIANTSFSAISGLSMLLFSELISKWMGITQENILQYVGLGLLLFSSFILWVLRQENISIQKVKMIILQDWVWVIGSVLVIVFQAFSLHETGYIIVGAVALVVANFAVLQGRYLRQYLP